MQVERLQSDIKELSALAENNESDKEMQEMAREELKEIKEKLDVLQEEVGREHHLCYVSATAYYNHWHCVSS